MTWPKSIGPGIEDYSEQYRLRFDYPQFCTKVNDYLRDNGANQLPAKVMRPLYEITEEFLRNLYAMEKFRLLLSGPDWKRRIRLMAKMNKTVATVDAVLKTFSNKRYPVTALLAISLLQKLHAVEAELNAVEEFIRLQESMFRKLLAAQGHNRRGQGPSATYVWAIDDHLTRALANKSKNDIDLIIVACHSAAGIFTKSQVDDPNADLAARFAMRRSRARALMSGEEDVVAPWRFARQLKPSK